MAFGRGRSSERPRVPRHLAAAPGKKPEPQDEWAAADEQASDDDVPLRAGLDGPEGDGGDQPERHDATTRGEDGTKDQLQSAEPGAHGRDLR